MNSFEKFIQKNSSYRDYSITILKGGAINFNLITMVKYARNKTYVTFYYDKENLLIGIKFSSQKTRAAYKIVKYRKGKFGAVSGKSFLNYYNIPYKDKTRKYLAEWNAQYNMLVINLKQ